MGEFAQAVSELATSDLGQSLSQSLEALAELERKAQEAGSAQARADQAAFLSTADEYARLVNSVRVSTIATALTLNATTDADLTPFFTDGVQFACASVSCMAKCRCGAAPH